MKKHQLHKSSLFLMELIIAIFFFALASAVCMRLFAKSYSLSRQAEELNIAVNKVSGKAEMLLHADTFFENITPEYYGKDFKSCSPEDAVYELTVESSRSSETGTYLIVFKNTNTREMIYHLTVDTYLPDSKQKGGI